MKGRKDAAMVLNVFKGNVQTAAHINLLADREKVLAVAHTIAT